MSKDFSDLKIIKAGKVGTGILIEHDSGYINPDDPRNQTFINELNSLESGKVSIMEPLYVYVVLQKYGVLNKNGRIYPEAILRKQDELYQLAIKERRALGELDHPESSVISGDRVSHNIVQTWWEGHTLMGRMEILMSTGFIKSGIISCKGDIVAHLLRHKITIGVSSRGVGSLKEGKDGTQIVQDDFEIICWDVVTAPSTPGPWIFRNKEDAKPFVEGVMSKKTPLNENLDRFLSE